MEFDDVMATMLKNLQKNGFPKQPVSFTSSSLAQFAHKHDRSLGSILSQLEKHGVVTEHKDDKIIFTMQGGESKNDLFATVLGAIDIDNLDLPNLDQNNPDDMQKLAMKVMKNMSPDKMAELQKKVMSMSPEEREELLKLGKQFGI